MSSVAVDANVPTEEQRAEMKRNKQIEEDAKTYKAAGTGAARLDKSKYTIWDDDAALGAKAPSLENLKWKKDGPYNYGDKPITVVGFWAKFAKGDYTTLNAWNFLQRKYADKGVQFVGVSRDIKEADCDKFISRLGSFLRELGEKGITTCTAYPLAYDPERALGDTFQKLSQIMSLPVGMCYVVDAQGVIQWREQFSRGGSPMAQLEGQLDLLVEGKPVAKLNGNEPEEEEEEEEEGEDAGKTTNTVIVAPGAADY